MTVLPHSAMAARTVVVFGTLAGPSSCETGDSALDDTYAAVMRCTSDEPGRCAQMFSGLQPGAWVHNILTTDDGPVQLEGRRALLLDASAGTRAVEWRLFASVQTVTTLTDTPDCAGCLRNAIAAANSAAKPALILFAPDLEGPIILTGALPPLSGSDITIDGLSLDGVPYGRAIDADGIDAAALKITSANNSVLGLRIANSGGNSDTVLIEGEGADNNLLDTVQVAGRTAVTCGEDLDGCLIDGVCQTPATHGRNGGCGDDGIAIRRNAGVGGVNLIRASEVSSAYDKGIKVSDHGVARVERCHVHDNRDGGIQTTLSGRLTAAENLVEDNAGTNSANGLAANGSALGSVDPASLETTGNISRRNSLRGVSVRNLSEADLHADYLCGNGTSKRNIGVGLLVDGTDAAASISARGMAVVNNPDGGVSITGPVAANFAGEGNAFAFNGSAATADSVNLRNFGPNAVAAGGNFWEHCGRRSWRCDESTVRDNDVFVGATAGSVGITAPLSNITRRPPVIAAIAPPFATAGEVIRIYGSGFDAIDGNGPDGRCGAIAALNSCRPLHGNCVLIGRSAAEVLAVTPTMLVVQSPFTCVTPVTVSVRTRYSTGFARHAFCVLPADRESAF